MIITNNSTTQQIISDLGIILEKNEIIDTINLSSKDVIDLYNSANLRTHLSDGTLLIQNTMKVSDGYCSAVDAITALNNIILNSVSSSLLGAASGVAMLDATSKLPIEQLPLQCNLLAGAPSSPTSGRAGLYSRNFAGKLQFGQIDPDGISNYIQNAIYGSYQFIWTPGPTNGLGISWGSPCTELLSGTGAGKIYPTITSTNVVTQMKRLQLGTGTTATGSDGLASNQFVCWRGNAARCGGFLFFARFALETYLASERIFIGLSPNSSALSGEPTALLNSIGLSKNSNDTTLQIIETNGSTSTKHNTGVTPSTTQILDFALYCKPNDTKVTAFLIDAATGAILVDNLVMTATLPVATTMFYAQALIQSTSGSTSKQLSIAKMYVETEI